MTRNKNDQEKTLDLPIREMQNLKRYYFFSPIRLEAMLKDTIPSVGKILSCARHTLK